MKLNWNVVPSGNKKDIKTETAQRIPSEKGVFNKNQKAIWLTNNTFKNQEFPINSATILFSGLSVHRLYKVIINVHVNTGSNKD